MYEILKQFIKPELLVVVPVIYIIGLWLKKSAIVNDKFIPLTLGIISIFICIIWVGATCTITNWQNALLSLFTAITQGILIASESVYINQLIKQSSK